MVVRVDVVEDESTILRNLPVEDLGQIVIEPVVEGKGG